jgi:hypothetical protein
MSLPSMSLGIVPFTADRSTMWPVEMFFMHDETQVKRRAGFRLPDRHPSEGDRHVRAGVRPTAGFAVFGATARTLITTAMDALA